MKDLRVRVGGDSTGFDSVMAKVRTEAAKLGAGLRTSVGGSIGGRLMGMVSVGAITLAARRTMDYADSIEELGNRIGVGTDKLQEWGFAAKQSGVDVQRLGMFVERLSDAARDADKQKFFQRMGINPVGMTPEALFGAVSGFTKGKSQSEIMGALEPLVGFQQLGPMINLLQSDLADLGASARKAGAVMDQQTLHALAMLNDQFSIISQILVSQFAPAVLMAAQALLKGYASIKGNAAYFGAKTAGMSIKEILFAPFLSKEQQQKIIDRQKKDPNQQVYNQTAENLYTEIVGGMDEMLKKLQNYQPPPLPRLDLLPEEKTKQRRLAELQLDALSKAGLFAGGAGKIGVNQNIPQEQLKAMRDIYKAHMETYRMLEEILS